MIFDDIFFFFNFLEVQIMQSDLTFNVISINLKKEWKKIDYLRDSLNYSPNGPVESCSSVPIHMINQEIKAN